MPVPLAETPTTGFAVPSPKVVTPDPLTVTFWFSVAAAAFWMVPRNSIARRNRITYKNMVFPSKRKPPITL